MLPEFMEAIRLMQRSAPDVTIKMQVDRKTLDRLGFELTASNRQNITPPEWYKFPALDLLGVYITEDKP